jgi:hypothetical protein
MAGTGRVAHHGWPLVSASIAFFLGAGVSRGSSASDVRVERQFPKSQCHRPLLGHSVGPIAMGDAHVEVLWGHVGTGWLGF